MAGYKGKRRGSYKKSASNKPNKTELATREMEKEILEFWKTLAKSEDQNWDKPWIMNALLAEDAGKFLNRDKRFTYTGGINQYLIAYYTRGKDPELGPLILNRTEMKTLFGVEKFEDSPVVTKYNEDGSKVENTGAFSVGAIFKPTTTKYWAYENGSPWNAPNGERRKPTQEEIQQQNLRERRGRTIFSTFPVWSMADIYPMLNEEQREKVDKLVEERRNIGCEFNMEDDFDKFIVDFTNDMLKRQGVQASFGSNRACYYPLLDKIEVPRPDQFKNPLFYLATVAHELAHSTKHLNGRRPVSKNKTHYAIEEVVAESTAAMTVKKVEEFLKPMLDQRPDVQVMFDDYYKNSHIYTRDYGNTAKLMDMVKELESVHEQELEDKKPMLLKTVMTNVAKAVESLLNQSYSPEERKIAMDKNVADPQWDLLKKAQQENTPSMG